MKKRTLFSMSSSLFYLQEREANIVSSSFEKRLGRIFMVEKKKEVVREGGVMRNKACLEGGSVFAGLIGGSGGWSLSSGTCMSLVSSTLTL